MGKCYDACIVLSSTDFQVPILAHSPAYVQKKAGACRAGRSPQENPVHCLPNRSRVCSRNDSKRIMRLFIASFTTATCAGVNVA